MTKPRYPMGCAARSEVRRLAPADPGYAWNVNLNNGNSNWNHHNNEYHARAVRAGECQHASFSALYAAWREARRGKKPSADQLHFDARWMDHLLDLKDRINGLKWHPGAPTCFIATAPKAREIHAPPFADRVVHHYLIPMLERLWEPAFIHDSYSNRIGKGTHAAIERLRAFVRQVAHGQGGGWYLQMDVKNFFNSIHRPTLYALLKPRMERAALPEHARRAVHALLNYPLSRTGVHWACTDAERAAVPAHKRLENAGDGNGIAIGNLSSQFFANVYLDRLDQFVKHGLHADRYLRYVDDFVLVHRDPAQLEIWRQAIAQFLRDELRLELKSDQRLAPLHQGIDFLGYIVFPTHTLVRRRVITHAREKLYAWRKSGAPVEHLRSVWASYTGHFVRSNCHRLLADFGRRFPWLASTLEPSGGPK